jgi:MFS family permease
LHPFILFAAFLNTFYIGLIGPILPALVDRYGGNAFIIGLLFSSYSFAQFLSAPILGAIGMSLGAACCGVWLWAEKNLNQVEQARYQFDEKARTVD